MQRGCSEKLIIAHVLLGAIKYFQSLQILGRIIILSRPGCVHLSLLRLYRRNYIFSYTVKPSNDNHNQPFFFTCDRAKRLTRSRVVINPIFAYDSMERQRIIGEKFANVCGNS